MCYREGVDFEWQFHQALQVLYAAMTTLSTPKEERLYWNEALTDKFLCLKVSWTVEVARFN